MALAAPGTQIHQTLDVHRHFAAQIAFGSELADLLAQLVHFTVGQVFHLAAGFDAGSNANLARAAATDAIDRRKRDFGVLMIRNVYATNTGHIVSIPLTLNTICANSRDYCQKIESRRL